MGDFLPVGSLLRRCLLIVLIGSALYCAFQTVGAFRKEAVFLFLNVGNGKAIAVRSPAGRVLLIDAGTDAHGQSRVARWIAERRILPALRQAGCHRIKGVMVTHPHDDHFNALPVLLGEFYPSLLWVPPYPVRNPTFSSFLQQAGLKKVRLVPFFRGQRLCLDSVDGLTAEVLYPDRHPLTGLVDGEVNEASAIVRVSYGRVRVLLTGDAGVRAQEHLVRRGDDLRAEILDVPHHGLRHLSREFVRAVRPRLAVISARRVGSAGPADGDVAPALEAMGARIWVTGVSGDLTVRTDGARIRLEGERSFGDEVL